MARQVCGEGMPIFYAQQVLDDDPYCLSKTFDPILKPVLQFFGVCKSIDDYGYRKDDEGLPVLEDCQ